MNWGAAATASAVRRPTTRGGGGGGGGAPPSAMVAGQGGGGPWEARRAGSNGERGEVSGGADAVSLAGEWRPPARARPRAAPPRRAAAASCPLPPPGSTRKTRTTRASSRRPASLHPPPSPPSWPRWRPTTIRGRDTACRCGEGGRGARGRGGRRDLATDRPSTPVSLSLSPRPRTCSAGTPGPWSCPAILATAGACTTR